MLSGKSKKLRLADDCHGPWDETVVREYWDVQKEAKTKLQETGVHTHFGTLFDLCVDTRNSKRPSTNTKAVLCLAAIEFMMNMA